MRRPVWHSISHLAVKYVSQNWHTAAFGHACLICQRVILPSDTIPGLCRHCQAQLPWRLHDAVLPWPSDSLDQAAEDFAANKVFLPAPKILCVCTYTHEIRKGLLALKFNDASEWAAPFAAMAVQTVQRSGFTFDAVVAVPLHPERLAERGYNQAGLITAEIASRLKLPDWSVFLIRHRATRRQSEQTSRADRSINLNGAFSWQGPLRMTALRVLLVDDVLTTGSTLSAAASPLFSAGATVTGLVIASNHKSDLSRFS